MSLQAGLLTILAYGIAVQGEDARSNAALNGEFPNPTSSELPNELLSIASLTVTDIISPGTNGSVGVNCTESVPRPAYSPVTRPRRY